MYKKGSGHCLQNYVHTLNTHESIPVCLCWPPLESTNSGTVDVLQKQQCGLVFEQNVLYWHLQKLQLLLTALGTPACRSARPSGWASSHRRNPRPPGRNGASSGAARTGRAGPHRGRRGAGGSAGSAAPRWRSPPRGRLPATWRAGAR